MDGGEGVNGADAGLHFCVELVWVAFEVEKEVVENVRQAVDVKKREKGGWRLGRERFEQGRCDEGEDRVGGGREGG